MAKKSTKKEIVKVKKTDMAKAPPKKKATKAIDFAGASRFPMETHETLDQPLDEYTGDKLKIYGSYVVEQRAVPDFRDGLKPVHRAVLWSMVDLGLRPSAPYKKSARTVGQAIGVYHPHGDTAAYDAMVTITNTVPPFVAGQGGFGSPSTSASAMRYTEAKMSKFTHSFLLDPDYLKVVPYEPNFSNDAKIPVYMPALLPTLFFITNIPAPAYGVKAGNPAFSMESVANVVVNMLRGKEYSGKKLAEKLDIYHPFGCLDVSKDDDIVELMETGKGKVTYAPLTETDIAKRTIYLRSHVPTTLASEESIGKTLAKIADIDGVKNAENTPGKKVKNSGPFGALCVVECPKNMDEDRFDEICASVDNIVRSSVNYRLGITVRHADKPNAFKYLDYVTYFKAWINYRLKLESRLIAHLIEKAEREKHINEVYLFAVENMDKLMKILPKVLVAKEPDVLLAKTMKIPLEDATIILDRKVRQLAKLEAAAIKEKISKLKEEIKTLKIEAKNPGERAAKDTEQRVKAYMKNPDVTQSGLPI